MDRTHLTPAQSTWLAETFRRNQATFGGLRMMADPDPDPDKGKGGDEPKPDADPDKGKGGDGDAGKGGKPDTGDEPLGEGGKRALESERKARKELADELASLKNGLASALGVKNDAEDGDDDKALLGKIQQQIEGMQREAAVLTIANTHKITDEDDLVLLRSAKDEDAMKKLAERLAPAPEDAGAKPGRRPKPDPSQGGGASGSGSSRGGSVAEVMAERRAAREKKSSASS